MRQYGLLPKEIDNPCVRRGDYGRYGHSKTHRRSYLRSERAIKRRERNNAKLEIQQVLTE